MTIPAVRTVSETDDFRTIEGLAYPFKSRDTYGTNFSARTNYHWDLFPDVSPGATRDGGPGFVRPVTFHHGFDDDFGLARIGGWSPVRMDDDGVWVQAQIDKRQRYYATRIKPLLDAGALGLSGGSAEHSVRIDSSGEILEWPAYELALTPVESNPLAQLAARAGEAVATFRIVPAVRGWLPEGTTEGDLDDGDFAWIGDVDGKKVRKLPYKVHGTVNEDGWKAAWSRVHQEGTDLDDAGRAAAIKKLLGDKPADVKLGDEATKSAVRYSPASWDASAAAYVLGSLLELLGSEADETEQAGHLRTAIAEIQAFISLEQAEIGTGADAPPVNVTETITLSAYQAAFREGRRNSTSDTAALTTAHDSIASVLGMDCAPGDASARSGEAAPGFRLVDGTPEPADPLMAMATRAAAQAAADAVRRLTG